jgi:hypothetical protein
VPHTLEQVHVQTYINLTNIFRTLPLSVYTTSEIAYALGRCWLQAVWSRYTIRGKWREGKLDNDHVIKYYSDCAEALFNLKAGHRALFTWCTHRDSQSSRCSSLKTQQALFEEQYQAILMEASLLEGHIQNYVALRSLTASQLSIIESRRGIEVSERAMEVTSRAERQSHAINRLTQLAFLFLPLTFVTGVFGMNIKPFNDGAPMWKFWLSMVCIAIPSFFFGLQTAREDITNIPKARRKKMITRVFGDLLDDQGRKTTEYWIKQGPSWLGLDSYLRNNRAWQAQAMGIKPTSYDQFLAASQVHDILLGVGPRAAAGHIIQRVYDMYQQLKPSLNLRNPEDLVRE